MTDFRTFRIVDEDGDYYEITGDPMDALNAAYRERAHLVALLAAIYPAEFREDPEDDDWSIIYLTLPTGQASWHIHPRDMDLFSGVKFGTAAEWDGHTTEEKYDRIDKLAHMLHVGEQPQDERDARIAELERELRGLRGTELNPSPMVLDVQAYGELRDEIAATMGDEWDLDEAEISILIKYVRWLAAGQPRDEDGYPLRRETYPAANAKAAQAERDGDVRAVAATLRWIRAEIAPERKLLGAVYSGAWTGLEDRFMDRIAALEARDAKAPARCTCGCELGKPCGCGDDVDHDPEGEAG